MWAKCVGLSTIIATTKLNTTCNWHSCNIERLNAVQNDCTHWRKISHKGWDKLLLHAAIFLVLLKFQHFAYLLALNYANRGANQSALLTRFGTDSHHQYIIFGCKLQTSLSQNALRGPGAMRGGCIRRLLLFKCYGYWGTQPVKLHSVKLLKMHTGILSTQTLSYASCIHFVLWRA